MKILLTTLLLTSSISFAGILPDEIGVPLHTIHTHNNSGPHAWNNKTHGVYALWDITTAYDTNIRALAAAMKLSNGRDGQMVGLMMEKGPLFVTLSAVRGYQKITYGNMPEYQTQNYVCSYYCYYRQAKNRIVPAVAGGMRFDLPEEWKLRITLQPRSSGNSSPFWDTRKDASVTVWVGKGL